MLYYLISLVPDFEQTPLRLFNYFTFRAAAALVTATLLGILLGKTTVKLLKRAVAPPRLEGIVEEQYVDHSKDKTPSMGGLLVVASIILATLLWGDLTNRLLLLFLCTLAAFSAIGFIDDFTKIKSKKDGVSAKYKLVCQFAISIMAILVYSHLTPEIARSFCDLYVPFIKEPVWVMPYPIAVAFAVFVLVGTSNAVNLTDGKDGLATGCTIWCMMTYALIAYLCTNSIFASHLDLPFIRNGAEIVVFAAAIIGACVGFLWHNCKPASMFMG
ncbi:MAG: phospho-N-acetylmuramoyl-pentapeptide-transferase, partial [Clostridia bacterium]|nr:phospho-N-acetylmuramoyl-pentapeptide-transferase [Clostridia bacterium]